jgi:hypothetical protein
MYVTSRIHLVIYKIGDIWFGMLESINQIL